MVFDRKGYEILLDNTNEPDAHARNFIDCLRSRQTPNAEIELGHISTTGIPQTLGDAAGWRPDHLIGWAGSVRRRAQCGPKQ